MSWAAAVAAVASALGSRARSKAGQVDLGKLRRDAMKNGFNPLTVLQATGGQGFTKAPGVLSFLSDGVSAGVSVLSDQEDRKLREELLALEREQTQALASERSERALQGVRVAEAAPGVAGENVYGGVGYYAEPAVDGVSPGAHPGRYGYHVAGLADGNVYSAAVGQQLPMFGASVEVGPWSPAQVVEDEYGDAVSLPYGAARVGRDVVAQSTKWAAETNYARTGANTYAPSRGRLLSEAARAAVEDRRQRQREGFEDARYGAPRVAPSRYGPAIGVGPARGGQPPFGMFQPYWAD